MQIRTPAAHVTVIHLSFNSKEIMVRVQPITIPSSSSSEKIMFIKTPKSIVIGYVYTIEIRSILNTGMTIGSYKKSAVGLLYILKGNFAEVIVCSQTQWTYSVPGSCNKSDDIFKCLNKSNELSRRDEIFTC